MASDPLEKKLDRYYDDIMSKIMEVLEGHKLILGEQKDLKKDVAKLKEHVLEAKTALERIDYRTEALKGLGVGYKVTEMSDTNQQGNIPKQNTNNTFSAPTPSQPQPRSVTPPSSIPTTIPKPSVQSSSQNLKDFLAQQAAIYDVKVLNAFIKATKDIVKTNARTDSSFIKPIIESNINLPIVITGKMRLSRDKGSGSMALCFDKASSAAITKAVFMLEEDAKVSDADVKDVTSEICNQICGKSKLALKNEGYNFEIEMPEIHQGTPAELYKILGSPKIALQFEFAKCPFYIYFWG